MSFVTSDAALTPCHQLEWNDVDYAFSKFLDQFSLPQLVRVQDGFCSKDETCSLSAGQVLTVRLFRTTDKVFALDRSNGKLHIPFECSRKVELCPPKAHVPFRATKERLQKHRFVRVVQDQRLSFGGMKLEVVRFEGILRKEVVFKKEDGRFVQLPLDTSLLCQPLVDGRDYSIHELSAMKLPVYFKFIDTPNTTAEKIFSSSLGVLRFEKTYRDTAVIYSIEHEGTQRQFACPKDMDITVRVPQGAVEGNQDYLDFCNSIRHDINLRKIADLEAENIYEDPNTIREYRSSSLILSQRASKQDYKTMAAPGGAQHSLSTQIGNGPGSDKSRPGRERKSSAPGDGKPPIPCMKGPPPPAVKPKPKKASSVAATPSRPSANEIEIPEQLENLSVDEVSHLLVKFNLAEFVHVFTGNQVDGSMLVSMDTDDMRALGMNAFQSRKLKRLTEGWRPKL